MKIEPKWPSPPKHLSADARKWWRNIMAEYGLTDQPGLLLLQTALEAFDRMKSAAARIDADGEAIVDRWGQIKPHPLLTTERDSRSQMLMALKQLNLEIEPQHVARIGRPSTGAR